MIYLLIERTNNLSILTIIILAFSMSFDAFAVTIAKGVKMHRVPSLSQTLRIGIIFGVVEAITPIIGWLIGAAAQDFVGTLGHWITLAILSIVGLTMILNYNAPIDEIAQEETPDTLQSLAITALATSIDAMAVGASLAFINVNIWVLSLTIGCATFIMSMIGITIGNYIGLRIGKIAEVIGGICLITIGLLLFFH